MNAEDVARLFLKHQSLLKDYIFGLVRDAHDAEDIFQEVGVRILSQKAAPPDRIDEFPAWSRGVARNMILHLWRSKRIEMGALRARFLQVVEAAYQERDVESESLENRRRALDECLNQLPERSRDLLQMRYGQGAFSHRMASRVGRSAAAVRMTLMRIRQALNACVERRILGALK